MRTAARMEWVACEDSGTKQRTINIEIAGIDTGEGGRQAKLEQAAKTRRKLTY